MSAGPKVVSTAFHRSLIRSDERLDYDRVDRIFGSRERAAPPWDASLMAARAAASALGSAREARAIALDAAEPEFRFDARGHVDEVLPVQQTESHRLIEHLMIAANEAVAAVLEDRSAARALPRPRAARPRGGQAAGRPARDARRPHAAGAGGHVALGGR